MRHSSPPAASGPFIAWAFTHEQNGLSLPVRQSCEKHLRSTMDKLTPLVGEPAIEGIIVYDKLECGAAVANMLWEQGTSLPRDVSGETCTRHFDEGEFCRQTNAFDVFARVHAGSKAMLITLNGPDNTPSDRRLMLLDQREASLLHPIGRDQSPELGLSALGLLAHELSHARDYADGRLGRPTAADIAARCAPAHQEAIAAISDMALAEYVATRDECAAQMRLYGACSQALVQRAETMARRPFEPPVLAAAPHDAGPDAGPDACPGADQQAQDWSGAGYTLGTLAAYVAASAPVMGKGGTLLRRNSAQHVLGSLPASSALGACLETIGPALESAARAPGEDARMHLAETFETSLMMARTPQASVAKSRGRDASASDWFDER